MSVSSIATWFSTAALLAFAPSCILWDWLLPSPSQEARQLRAIDLYFYDMTTGKLFSAPSDQIPPIETPNGPHAGVRAHVFACDECPGNLVGKTAEEVRETGAYIAYLEMYTPEGKAALLAALQPRPEGPPAPALLTDPMEHAQVKRFEDPKWLSMYSQAGYQLTDDAIIQCPNDTPARACRP